MNQIRCRVRIRDRLGQSGRKWERVEGEGVEVVVEEGVGIKTN